MKRIALFTSIALIVIGFITARVGDSLSTVNASGMIQDSILMPVGLILFVLGIVVLFAAVLWYLIDFVRGRLQKD